MEREGSSLAERWTRGVLSLQGAPLRIAYLRTEIEESELEATAEALEEIAYRGEQAEGRAREVLFALVPLLADEAMAGWVVALRAEARARAHLSLGRLLGGGHSKNVLAEPSLRVDERRLAASNAGRPLTLGERRALARRPSRASLEKLLLDPHPMVMRNVLDNPRLTEDDVLRIASRRPGHGAVLQEIARHAKWSLRGRVRMALVLNPHTPTGAAVGLLRLLTRGELGLVVESTGSPGVVRAAARELLERRPPVPDRGGGEMQ